MKIHKQIVVMMISIMLPLSFSSCWIYSLSGASLSPEIKSFTVSPFVNQASLIVPSLAEDLTEKLRDKFRSEMNLNQVSQNGDISFTGVITNYKTGPASVSSGDFAATTRLSISVSVEYENTKEPDQNYKATFTNYVDFDSNLDFASVENQLVQEIIEMLVQDIFNRAVNNW